MHNRGVVLGLVLFSCGLPATGAINMAPGAKIATALGVRYENPTAHLKIGQKTTAYVVNAAKLGERQVRARTEEKVEITLTGPHSLTVFHPASGRLLKYTFTDQGVLTAVP
jgi:hypothetical protein